MSQEDFVIWPDEEAEDDAWMDDLLDAFRDGVGLDEGASDLDDDLLDEDDDLLDEDDEDIDDYPLLAEGLREVLREEYSESSAEEVEEALFNILDSMSPAEAFSFKKLLRGVAKAGKKVLKDPIVSQVAGTVLPVAGGALGTFVGGPIGTAFGSQLGGLAAKAFKQPSVRAVTPTPRAPGAPAPSVMAGSPAAAQALVMAQNPDILKSLLSVALGSQGKKTVGGVPVGAFLNMLSGTLMKAAKDADELSRLSESEYLQGPDGESLVDSANSEERSAALYRALLRAEEQRLADGYGV